MHLFRPSDLTVRLLLGILLNSARAVKCVYEVSLFYIQKPQVFEYKKVTS